MGADGPLTGWSFLVTRPAQRGDRLSAMLERQGAMVIQRPSLVIGEMEDPMPVADAMERADLAIFVSIYAVNALSQALALRPLSFRKSLRIAAVGGATADALKQLGLKVTFAPPGSTGSEGLIDALAGSNWQKREVALFAADTGRRVLAEWLTERGARVSRIIAYTRQPNPDADFDAVAGFLASPQRVITFTSLESARALTSAIPPGSRENLFASNLIVISQRIADGCRSMGFQGELDVADDTLDKTIVTLAIAQAGGQGVVTDLSTNDNSGGEGL